MENKRFKRTIQRTLYSLKRRYGGPATFTRIINTSTDFETGDKTSDKLEVKIKRAIRLPHNAYRTFPNLAFVMKQSGATDLGDRDVIIEGKDIPVVPRMGDSLKIDEEEYTVSKVESLDYNLGYLVQCTSN